MKLCWTTPALRDLESLGDYIAQTNAAAARRIVSEILEQANRLPDFPESGRPGRVRGTRELVVASTRFIVPYRVRGDQIEVLAVFHGAREWPEDFDEGSARS